MSRINNVQRIIKEDFKEEDRDTIDKLAFVLNSFMEQVTRQINGNINNENLASDIVTVKMTVNASGVPVGNNLIKSDVPRPSGTDVIRTINNTNSSTYPTSRPHISYIVTENPQVIKVLHISGLQANNEYSLTIKFEPTN